MKRKFFTLIFATLVLAGCGTLSTLSTSSSQRRFNDGIYSAQANRAANKKEAELNQTVSLKLFPSVESLSQNDPSYHYDHNHIWISGYNCGYHDSWSGWGYDPYFGGYYDYNGYYYGFPYYGFSRYTYDPWYYDPWYYGPYYGGFYGGYYGGFYDPWRYAPFGYYQWVYGYTPYYVWGYYPGIYPGYHGFYPGNVIHTTIRKNTIAVNNVRAAATGRHGSMPGIAVQKNANGVTTITSYGTKRNAGSGMGYRTNQSSGTRYLERERDNQNTYRNANTYNNEPQRNNYQPATTTRTTNPGYSGGGMNSGSSSRGGGFSAPAGNTGASSRSRH